ncbi:MAG: ABC transporter permease [Bacteroidota bacterium]
MKQIWIIARRELKSFFDSLLAYILMVIFLAATGLFTWLYGHDVFFYKQASLQSFFSVAYWSFFLLMPALTMRLIAEEKSSGTLEMVLTKAVSDWQVVVGKFLSVFLLICITLALTLPYYITVASIGPIDHGAVLTGYLGLILMSSAYISIGVFASSLTHNQIVAFLIAFFIGIFFHLIVGFIATNFSGTIGGVLNFLSTTSHYESMSRGVIDSKDVIFFLSLIFMGLFGSEMVLARRNVAD